MSQQFQLQRVRSAPERETRFLTVSQAAQLLDVHQNTIRHWSDRGIIRAVWLPTGQRRFELTEVERVRKGYFAGQPLPPSTRVRTDEAEPV